MIEPLKAQVDKFKERVIATIPDSYLTVNFAYVAPDGETYVYAGQKNDGTAVTYNGKEIATGLIGGFYQYPPEKSKNILLEGTWGAEKYVLIFNDQVYKTQANRAGMYLEAVTQSTEEPHIAYLANENNKRNLYVDGQLIVTNAQYLGSSMRSNGEVKITNEGTWAVTASKDKHDYILTANREYGPFEHVGLPVFSPDGKHLAFFAKDEKGSYLMFDGEVKYQVGDFYYRSGDITFNSDGSSMCFRTNINGAYYYTVDGKNEIPAKNVKFLPKWVAGKFLYGVETDNNRINIVYGDKTFECEKLDELTEPIVSKDGNVIAYSGNLSGITFTPNGEQKQVYEGYIILNGIKEKALSCVKKFVLTDVGKVAAYVAEYRQMNQNQLFSQQVVVINKQPGKVYKKIEHLSCSNDGKSIAYIALDNDKAYFVLGVQESEPYDRIFPPIFSDDGTKVAYAALKGHQLLWKVIENKKVIK